MKYTSKVIEHKGKLCVILPIQVIKELGWKVGTKVDIKYNSHLHAIVIKKV